VDSIEVGSTARGSAGSPKFTYNTNVPRYNLMKKKKRKGKRQELHEKIIW
jgi:hypothetical protein